ncbi:uncharacterized protein LOC127363557 [Dicentrarchus labrax]|uniref:uncharacterized protein LOC127363557 n=1 Tax=Dicentrarchus labrax TaxID=13489 RepID=UPI0021F65E1F|nr:uncharacterized protein LOC127363557 [Dicentrarchus labrax]XP_051256162.1 uncharacterized protein LOC127363557 [Dicentrarchus labrax]
MFCRTLLLIILTFMVWSEKLTTRDQGGSKIISLEIPNETDLSRANIKCFRLKDGEVFFVVQNGERAPSSNKYKGRVNCTRNGGRLDIDLSNFTNDDEGKYRCHFFKSLENFVLTLPTPGPLAAEESNTVDVPLTTPTSGPAAADGTTQPPVGPTKYWIGVVVLVLVLVAVVVYFNRDKLPKRDQLLHWWRDQHVEDQAQPEGTELQNLNGEVPPSETGNGRSPTEERDDSSIAETKV